MIVFVALSLAWLQAPSARDFFPTAPGIRWTYQETGEDTLTYSYAIEEAKTIGGKEAVPLVISYKGNPLTRTYYVSDDTSVGIVSEDGAAVYSPPRPLFKVGPDTQTWTYSGEVPFDSGSAALSMTGSSHLGEKRTVFGQVVETLYVTIDATVTPPVPPKSRSKPQQIVQHQEAVYGKGIGLLEMTMTATVGGQPHKQHLELTKFQRGRSG